MIQFVFLQNTNWSRKTIEWIQNNCDNVEKTCYSVFIIDIPCLTNIYNTGKIY